MGEFDWRTWTPKLAAFYEALLRAESAGKGSAHLVDLRQALRYGLTADLASFHDDPLATLSKGELRLTLASDDEPADELELELSEVDESETPPDHDPEADDEPEGPDPQASSTLRRIARKQRNDPYNRETLLGYPIIGVRVGSRRHCGPLLVWETDIGYDPRSRVIWLRRRNNTPDLNTLLLSRLADDPDDIALVNEQVLPMLMGEDFSPALIPELLRTLTGIFEPLNTVRETDDVGSSLKDFLQRVSRTGEGDPALVSHRLVLANGPRSNAFLLSDLREIAAQSNPSGESVLAQVVGDVPKEGAPRLDPINLPFDDTSDGGSPLWFPFPSNRSQREVAQTATRANVLTVQGPPGTGKSQTISNLVCHLVTEGYSVLVTSHQRKAMEVLSKMLGEFDGVALSMLRGDQESLQKLRTQLEGVQDRPPDHETEESVTRGTETLLERDRELRRLQRRFMELKRLEHEEFPAFARYEDLRDSDHLSPADDPVDERAPEVAKALREWAEIFRVLHRSLHSFEAVFRSQGPETSRIREAQVADLLGQLLAAAESLQEPISERGTALAERTLQAHAADSLEVLSGLADWIRSTAPDLNRGFRDLGEDPSSPGCPKRWYECLGGITRDRVGAWKSETTRLREAFDRSPLKGREYDWDFLERSRGPILREKELLEEKGRKLLFWYLTPSAYRARRFLAEAGFTIRRADFDRSIAEVDDALSWNETYGTAESHLQEMLERVPSDSFGHTRPRTTDSVRRALRQAYAASKLLMDLDALPVGDFESAFGSTDPMYRAIAGQDSRDELLNDVAQAKRWLGRRFFTREVVEQLEIPEPWAGRVEAIAEGVLEGDLSGAEAAFKQCSQLCEYYPHFRRLVDLESIELAGLSGTLQKLRESIDGTGVVPEWLSHAEQSVEAHRLSSMLRASLSVHPDSLEEISEALTVGQDQRRSTIAEIVRLKRRLEVTEALETPSVRVPLRTLRKLLRRKRLNDSLVALRGSIDYSAVLRVFPCWIATIEDATRLFPPTSGLFDFLIVDEASQCGQATAMPLAFRAKKMIVVGDEKQLQPSGARFLAENAIRMLQKEHGLHDHPKAHFLDGKISLLGLAESCSNASRFLNEHFRCDPAIIRWSNNRFYDNRLQVLTRRRSDRARIPLEVRELTGADEDRDDKVNREEAEAIVREVRRLVSADEAKGKTIGVISPFRPQSELLQLLLLREFSQDPEALKRHEIVASTADGFQGDERDIVLYSFRHGPSSHAGAVLAIQREEERLNVAFTRARERAICFVSMPVHQFPQGAIRDFLEHAITEHARAQEWTVDGDWPDKFDSQFEEAVCERLRDRGLRVTTQVPCGRYRIDAVVEDAEGRQLAVECDGEWKEDDLGQLRPEDYQRQDIIERAGWVVHRISGRRWLLNPEREIDQTLAALAMQPSRAALERFLETPDDDAVLGLDRSETDPEDEEPDDPDGIGGSRDLTPPVPPDAGPASEEAAVDSDEGASPDPRTDLVHELIHWNIIRPSPEWPVIERLQEIHSSMAKAEPLTHLQEELVVEALDMARNAGFRPTAPLPSSPPEPPPPLPRAPT